MPVPDLFAEGLARGWTTHDGSRLPHDLTLEADIAIVGSGIAGLTCAYLLNGDSICGRGTSSNGKRHCWCAVSILNLLRSCEI